MLEETPNAILLSIVGAAIVVVGLIKCICCQQNDRGRHRGPSSYSSQRDTVQLEDLLTKPALADPESVFSEPSIHYDENYSVFNTSPSADDSHGRRGSEMYNAFNTFPSSDQMAQLPTPKEDGYGKGGTNEASNVAGLEENEIGARSMPGMDKMSVDIIDDIEDVLTSPTSTTRLISTRKNSALEERSLGNENVQHLADQSGSQTNEWNETKSFSPKSKDLTCEMPIETKQTLFNNEGKVQKGTHVPNKMLDDEIQTQNNEHKEATVGGSLRQENATEASNSTDVHMADNTANHKIKDTLPIAEQILTLPLPPFDKTNSDRQAWVPNISDISSTNKQTSLSNQFNVSTGTKIPSEFSVFIADPGTSRLRKARFQKTKNSLESEDVNTTDSVSQCNYNHEVDPVQNMNCLDVTKSNNKNEEFRNGNDLLFEENQMSGTIIDGVLCNTNVYTNKGSINNSEGSSNSNVTTSVKLNNRDSTDNPIVTMRRQFSDDTTIHTQTHPKQRMQTLSLNLQIDFHFDDEYIQPSTNISFSPPKLSTNMSKRNTGSEQNNPEKIDKKSLADLYKKNNLSRRIKNVFAEEDESRKEHILEECFGDKPFVQDADTRLSRKRRSEPAITKSRPQGNERPVRAVRSLLLTPSKGRLERRRSVKLYRSKLVSPANKTLRVKKIPKTPNESGTLPHASRTKPVGRNNSASKRRKVQMFDGVFLHQAQPFSDTGSFCGFKCQDVFSKQKDVSKERNGVNELLLTSDDKQGITTIKEDNLYTTLRKKTGLSNLKARGDLTRSQSEPVFNIAPAEAGVNSNVEQTGSASAIVNCVEACREKIGGSENESKSERIDGKVSQCKSTDDNVYKTNRETNQTMVFKTLKKQTIDLVVQNKKPTPKPRLSGVTTTPIKRKCTNEENTKIHKEAGAETNDISGAPEIPTETNINRHNQCQQQHDDKTESISHNEFFHPEKKNTQAQVNTNKRGVLMEAVPNKQNEFEASNIKICPPSLPPQENRPRVPATVIEVSDESDYDNPWDSLDNAVQRASIRYNRRPSRVAAGIDTKTLLLKSAEDLGRLMEQAEKRRQLRQNAARSTCHGPNGEVISPDSPEASLTIPFTRFSPHRHTVKGLVSQQISPLIKPLDNIRGTNSCRSKTRPEKYETPKRVPESRNKDRDSNLGAEADTEDDDSMEVKVRQTSGTSSSRRPMSLNMKLPNKIVSPESQKRKK